MELCYTPKEAFALLKISRNVGYELLRTRKLKSVSVGRIIRIPHTALEPFLEGIDPKTR
jgi:excisionase family DNA binding protein